MNCKACSDGRGMRSLARRSATWWGEESRTSFALAVQEEGQRQQAEQQQDGGAHGATCDDAHRHHLCAGERGDMVTPLAYGAPW